jgi:hypothetical protein
VDVQSPSSGNKFMCEPEVALRFAFWVQDNRGNEGAHADVAIDGATIQIQERVIFDIARFLSENGCRPEHLNDSWRGNYRRNGHGLTLKSMQGFDVQVRCGSTDVKAECKSRMQRRSASTKRQKRFGHLCLCNRTGDYL